MTKALIAKWLPLLFLALVMIGGVKDFINRIDPAKSAKDTIGWKQLAAVSFDGKKVLFDAAVTARDGKDVCISGYMFPLQGTKDQAHFLLSAYQPTCPFCLPAGRAELIEITGSDAVTYESGLVTLCGKLRLMKTPAELDGGMLYAMSDVRLAK